MKSGAPDESRVGGFLSGLAMPLRGAWLLVRTPGAAMPVLVPIALTAAATLAAAGAMAGAGDRLAALLWSAPQACDGCGIAAQVWAAMARVGWHVFRWVLALAVTAAVGVAVSRVACAPFLDVLARRVLASLGAVLPADSDGQLRIAATVAVSLGESLRRAVVLAAGLAAVLALSTVPGGALLTGPLGAAWSAAWLFADTVVYPLTWTGRARLADVTALVRERPAASLGFAMTNALLALLPLAGLLATPAAVAGACLLVYAPGRRDQHAAVATA